MFILQQKNKDFGNKTQIILRFKKKKNDKNPRLTNNKVSYSKHSVESEKKKEI